MSENDKIKAVKDVESLDKSKINFLFDVIKRYDHYIATSNFKIGLTSSFLVAVIVLLFKIFESIPKLALSDNWNYAFGGLITCILICCVFSFINVFRAVHPSLESSRNKHSVIFYNDVIATNDGEVGYHEKILSISEADFLKDLALQTYQVAKITNDKFRKIGLAINIVLFGVLPLLTLTILCFLFKGLI